MNIVKATFEFHNILNQSGNDYIANIWFENHFSLVINIEPKDENENIILKLSGILIEKMSEKNTETGSYGDGLTCLIKKIDSTHYLFTTEHKNPLKNVLSSICVKYNLEPTMNNILKIKQIVESRILSYKCRDKKYNINKTIGTRDLCEIINNSENKCYYCNNTVYLNFEEKYNENKMTFDAMVPTNGHIKTNICICCYKCNSIKSTQTDLQFKSAFEM
jgi:hypothetical protein